MTDDNAVHREILLSQPPEQVWLALTNADALADWMFPNDFEPRLGHRFTFRVPGNPKVNFDGLTVHCEVLALDPPTRLVFSWSAGGAVTDTRVTFQLEPHAAGGTRLTLHHAGFDLTHPHGPHALRGADHGWARMLTQLEKVLTTNN